MAERAALKEKKGIFRAGSYLKSPWPSSHSLFSSRLLFIANCVSNLATHSNQCSVSAWTFNTPGQTTKGPLNSHAKQRRIQEPTLAFCFYLLLRTILGPPVKARLWGDGTFGNGQEPKGVLTGITLAFGVLNRKVGRRRGAEKKRKDWDPGQLRRVPSVTFPP